MISALKHLFAANREPLAQPVDHWDAADEVIK
jgi:hypothetical protein